MTLLGGYDTCIEVTQPVLLGFLLANGFEPFRNLTPPFEIKIDDTASQAAFHAMVSNVALDLVPAVASGPPGAVVTLTFGCGNVFVQGSLVFYGFQGTIAIRLDLSMVPAGTFTRWTLGFTVPNTSQAVTAVLQMELGGADPQNRLPALQTEIQDNLRSELVKKGTQPLLSGAGLPFEFVLNAGEDGDITSSPPRFMALDLACIGGPGAAGTLCLLGTVFTSSIGRGVATQKDVGAVTAPNHAAVSISAEVFHRQYFCKPLAKKFGVPVDELCASCGNSPSLATSYGASLTSVSDAFTDGAITYDGAATQSGFCYTMNATFSGRMTFAVVGGEVIPTDVPDDPTVVVDVPWWCYLVAAVLGWFPLAIVAIADAIADPIVDGVADGVLRTLTSSATAGLTPGTKALPLKLAAGPVPITPEAMTLQGTFVIPKAEATARWPYTQIIKATEDIGAPVTIGGGSFHSDECPKGDWPFTEYTQFQQVTLTALSSKLCEPVNYEWSLAASGQILAGNGVATLDADVSFMTPLPGGTRHRAPVTIQYTGTAKSLTLINEPADGNFRVSVVLTATDHHGTALVNAEYVSFYGNRIRVDDVLYAGLAHVCAVEAEMWLSEQAKRGKTWRDGTEIVELLPLDFFRREPIDIWGPKRLAQHIDDIVRLGLPNAAARLAQLRVATGPAFDEAVLGISAIRAQSGGADIREIGAGPQR